MQDNKNTENKKKKRVRKKSSKSLNTKTERDYKTSSHSAQRRDRERQKIRKERLAARKAELQKKGMITGAVVLVLLLVIILAACPGKKQKETTKDGLNQATSAVSTTDTTAGNTETTAQEGAENADEESVSAENAAISAADVRHFCFSTLLSDEMAGDNRVLTVSQFRQILQELYDSNYILVDFYSIAGVEEKEDGSSSFTEKKLDIPAGKIPFVLSQRDVSYSLDRIGKGYASKLLVGDGDQLFNEYQRADGAIMRGSYDVIPILEEFIAEHPDFAYENARGVIGLTGYNGILGYRTSENLGKTVEEGNPYGIYGSFDVKAEVEACKPVVETLKDKGWHFACYGYSYCSYGAEYDLVTADVDSWMNNVSDLIGGTDIMLFPCETDIGPWSEYKADNKKYQYLKDQGFNYYCIEEKNNPSWLQIRPDYVRQGIKEIDNIDDFQQLVGE